MLADLADALPLQILPPNLSVDHDLLVLEQHHDVRAAEHEEAELVALLQMQSAGAQSGPGPGTPLANVKLMRCQRR